MYTPRDYASEGSWHAEGGGVGSAGSGVAGGVGAVRGGDKRHSVSENWVQCGFCFEKYHEDMENFKNYNKKLGLICGGMAFLGLAIGFLIFRSLKEKSDLILLLLGGGLIGGAIIGSIIAHAIYGSKPEEPNRYKLRVKERRIYDLKRK